MNSFNKRVAMLEKKAIKHIGSLLPQNENYLILFDIDNTENYLQEDISDMPDFPYHSDHAGFEEYANICGIRRYGKEIIITAITKQIGRTVHVNLHEIECYGLCSLADFLTNKFN